MNLEKNLDKYYSKYVRLKYTTVNGCKCYTCGITHDWKIMQCGHFISRRNKATRWLLDNLRPQCKACNQIKHGNLEKFAENLEKESPGIVKKLKNLSKTVKTFSGSELRTMLISIKFAVKELEKLHDIQH